MLTIGDVVTEVKLPQGGHWCGFQRAEFLNVIYEAVSKNPKVRLHTNKRVRKVLAVADGKMKVTFEDGTEAAADLVIGADGIHSVVRSKYLQDEAIFSGTVAYRALIPTDKVREFWPVEDSDVAGFWSQQGKAFLTYSPLSRTWLISDTLSQQTVGY
jgi:salicylate hydroxylase